MCYYRNVFYILKISCKIILSILHEISPEIYLFQGILWIFRKNHYYPAIGIFSQNSFFFPALDIRKKKNYVHFIYQIYVQEEKYINVSKNCKCGKIYAH